MSLEFKIFLIAAAVQCIYYLFVFFRLNFIRPFNSLPENLPPASIIICAKNEAQNLLQNLKVVLIQQYKQYEVIVVNDGSTDNSIDVLVEYYKRNRNFKIINIETNEQKPYAGKKYALLKGIEAATFDTIIVTDADCRPATTQWLAKIVASYMDDTKIVLAHSPYEKRPGFLNKLIRYENFITALQYFGFAKLGLPYMGVGRNLSYKKDLFTAFKGFDKTKNLPTGDDDLFVNASATAGNTEICIDKDTFTFTKPETSFAAWLNQKRRHLRSGFHYKFHHIILLFLFALSNFIFYALIFLLIAKGVKLAPVAGIVSGVLLVKILSVLKVYKKLGAEDLFLLTPVLDFAYVLYLLIIFFLLLLKPQTSWK
jgi:cellulose synthase/poly-beta-1,6-N-acetylglucosamine synthase-like glycosyltransferase